MALQPILSFVKPRPPAKWLIYGPGPATIALRDRHLRRILTCYVTYDHRARTHLALDKDAPDRRPVELPAGQIVQLPEVGGLHHRYVRQAA